MGALYSLPLNSIVSFLEKGTSLQNANGLSPRLSILSPRITVNSVIDSLINALVPMCVALVRLASFSAVYANEKSPR